MGDTHRTLITQRTEYEWGIMNVIAHLYVRRSKEKLPFYRHAPKCDVRDQVHIPGNLAANAPMRNPDPDPKCLNRGFPNQSLQTAAVHSVEDAETAQCDLCRAKRSMHRYLLQQDARVGHHR